MYYTIFASFGLVAAAARNTDGDAFGATQLTSGVNINYTAWRELAAHSNATGSIAITGYNVSAPFPQTAADAESVPWNLTLRVVADIPALDGGKYVTGAAVTLDPPAELQGKQVNGSWANCFVAWSTTSHHSTADSNGGCSGFLSQKCIKALETAFSNPNVCSNGDYTPDDCGSELETTGGLGAACKWASFLEREC